MRLLTLKLVLIKSAFAKYEITVDENPPEEASSIIINLLWFLAICIYISLSKGFANLASATLTE